MTYEQWMRKVNQIVSRRIFFEADDLPDWDWMVEFEAGTSPNEAATQFIEDTLSDYIGMDDVEMMEEIAAYGF